MNGRLITSQRKRERQRERFKYVFGFSWVAVWRALLKFKYSVQKEGWTEGIPRDWSVHRTHDAEGVFDKYFPPRRRVSRDIYSGHLGPNAIYFHPAAEEKGKE